MFDHHWDGAHDLAASGVTRVAFICEDVPLPKSPHGNLHNAQSAYMARLAAELSLMGCHVDIFTRRNSSVSDQVVQWHERVRVIHVPAGPPRSLTRARLQLYMEAFERFVTAFARRLTRPYDIVHASSAATGVVARQLKRQLGIPFVVFAQPLQPCGYDPQELWPVPMRLARQKLRLPLGRFIIFTPGGVAPCPDAGTMLRVLASLRNEHGIDALLLIAAASAAQHEHGDALLPARAARVLAAALELGPHVRFIDTPRRDALRYHYSAADVVVSGCAAEPFDMASIEAMACARPVMAAGNPAEVAHRLAALHAKPDVVTETGDQAMRRAFEHHTWRAVARNMHGLYTRVCSRRVTPGHEGATAMERCGS